MPIRAHTRRDPQNGKSGFSTNNGFTLIETMITVAVIAIITSLALPSYRTIIEKRQVTNGAEQLGAFLSSIQMEAVKRSENITVSYKQTTNSPPAWCIGLATGTTACDCAVTDPGTADCKIDSVVRIFNQDSMKNPGVLADMDGDGAFVYDPGRGLMMNHADAMEMELVSDKGKYALNVQLTATGRVKYCSDSSGKAVPGYKVCGTDIQ